jgi:hypothetical protein
MEILFCRAVIPARDDQKNAGTNAGALNNVQA